MDLVVRRLIARHLEAEKQDLAGRVRKTGRQGRAVFHLPDGSIHDRQRLSRMQVNGPERQPKNGDNPEKRGHKTYLGARGACCMSCTLGLTGVWSDVNDRG